MATAASRTHAGLRRLAEARIPAVRMVHSMELGDMDYRFKSKVWYAAAMGAASCASYAIEKSPDWAATANAVISAAIPSATSVRLRQRADLDSDGDTDVLLVLERTDDALARNEPGALVIFLRNERGTLEMAATSPSAILCQTCGGDG